MSQRAPVATAPPSILRAAAVFALVGPAMSAVLFAVVFSVFGYFSMGLGSLFAAIFYAAWITPWLYLALGVPFLLTGIAYAIAARRYARPSLLMALVAAAFVNTIGLGLLCLLDWLSGYSLLGAASFTTSEFLKGLGTLCGAMVIGVVPSWWLVRSPGARLRWI